MHAKTPIIMTTTSDADKDSSAMKNAMTAVTNEVVYIIATAIDTGIKVTAQNVHIIDPNP